VKKFIIDTNALISFVTDRNLKQQQIMKSVLETASLLKGIILCHSHVLTEFVYVMEKIYQVPPEEIKEMVMDFMILPGVRVVQEINFKAVFDYWPKVIADFGDALVAALCKAQKGSFLLTFDQKLIRQIKTAGLTAYSSE
jgi:predicted nucleic-acid-binding protein